MFKKLVMDRRFDSNFFYINNIISFWSFKRCLSWVNQTPKFLRDNFSYFRVSSQCL